MKARNTAQPHRHQGGMTLVEVMVATSVLSIGVVGAATVLHQLGTLWPIPEQVYRSEAEMAQWYYQQRFLSRHHPDQLHTSSGVFSDGRQWFIWAEQAGWRWSVSAHPDYPQWLGEESGWYRR
ncbi:prepilin-type N-terminal cleavage/methylation domain-containing protein [Aliidiomarina halalkaliphila]|uniref:Prepilin-type N-terminal cleavage/methylation domain-containing protein n=1 Tax=Aliidiomarina halalkaliphila TaxID=2593535 RepID=A0A552X5I9_9GAMM|nr:prepilin-type N-terminal cleavage/methylation domain-containing protein [Aliidiomarina halalkaliphila]TRW50278.1 prepilin-type N-terminal cleavage/methylation domain-containing protein [Aliidiomarina halalkaliphila]